MERARLLVPLCVTSLVTAEKHACLSHSRSCASLFNVIFTRFLLTPRDNSDTLLIKRRHKVFPSSYLSQSLVVCLPGLFEHIFLYGLEKCGNSGGEIGEGNSGFYSDVTTNRERLLFLQICRTNLESEWNTLRSSRVELTGKFQYNLERTFCSQSLNLYPGVYPSRKSAFAFTPTFFSDTARSWQASRIVFRCSSDVLAVKPQGTTMACTDATRGGRTKP
jgi:hypothetical protein